LEKSHAGIADQNNLLEGPKLFYGKLTPVGMICQGIWGQKGFEIWGRGIEGLGI